MKNITAKAWSFLMVILICSDARAAVMCGQQDQNGLVTSVSQCVSGVDINQQAGNLCPLQQSDCSLSQYRCVTTNQVYPDKPTCDGQCTKTTSCPSAPFSATLTGSGTGARCTDDWMYSRITQSPTNPLLFNMELLDTSPSGVQHWNCEWDLPPNTWHWAASADFTSILPASNGWDSWNVAVHFCVAPLYMDPTSVLFPKDTSTITCPTRGLCGSWQCSDQLDVPVGSEWDTASGAHTWNYVYKYTINVSNNDYTCPLDSNAACTGTAGSVVHGGATSPDALSGSGSNAGGFNLASGSGNKITISSIRTAGSASITSAGCTFSGAVYVPYGNLSITWAGFDKVVGLGNTITFYSGGSNYGSVTLTGDSITPACTASGTASAPGVGFDSAIGSGNSIAFSSGGVSAGSIVLTQNVTAYYPSASKTCSLPQVCKWEPLCPLGYGCDCSNGTAPTCASGGSFVGAPTNKCVIPLTSLCPAGFTADTSDHGCAKTPDCTVGQFNKISGFCETSTPILCDPGYVYDVSTDSCENLLSCPIGSTWSGTLGQCASDASICPANYGYDNALNKCYANATCSTGLLNIASDQCEYPPTCPFGTTYNAVYNDCTIAPTGPAGMTLNIASNQFEGEPVWTCASGYTYNSSRQICEAAPLCGAGLSYNGATGQCEGAQTYTCATGTYNGVSGKCEYVPLCLSGTTYSASLNLCTVLSTGPIGTTLNTTTGQYEAVPSCPAGTTYNISAALCTAVASACSGTDAFDSSRGKCTSAATYACPTGSAWDTTANICVEAATCPSSGSVNASSGKCELPATADCSGFPGTTFNATTGRCDATPGPSTSCLSGYVYNSANAQCEAAPQCPSGTAYDPALNVCTVAQSRSCPAGTSFETSTGLCYSAANCLLGTTLNGSTDKCETAYSCLTGTAYNSTIGKCTVAAICPTGTTLNSSLNICQ